MSRSAVRPPAKSSRAPGAAKRNRVRIIGGHWRSRLIEFPDVIGLRPTPDRVRETVFNWLGQQLTGKVCLDLFAGSGALGFEAASRGASEVWLVEADRHAVDALKANCTRLDATQCRVLLADAVRALAQMTPVFDVVFLDPPFASTLLPTVLGLLPPHLAGGALVYAEWREPLARLIETMPEAGWLIAREGKAGAAHFALLSRNPPPAP